MREYVANPKLTIPLGRQGEDGAVLVKFPICDWERTYGSGSFELLNMRPTEKTPYTCSITADDNYIYWIIQAADVAIVGHGKCELTYVVDGNVAKSLMFGTCVLKSIEGSGEVPPAYESRIQDLILASAQVTQDAARAENAQQGAENAQEAAENAQEAAENAQQAAEEAQAAAENAQQQAEEYADFSKDAEAWATGKRDGQDVQPGDVTFQNNAEYYAGKAQQVAVNNGYAAMWVDGDGELYLARTSNIVDNLDFRLTNDGELEALIYG